jgi:hypothetical protein
MIIANFLNPGNALHCLLCAELELSFNFSACG